MMDPTLFEDRVLKPCKPQALRNLLQRLHQLHFPPGDILFAYCWVVDPEDFLRVCRSELETLSRPAKPSSSQQAPRAEASGLKVAEWRVV